MHKCYRAFLGGVGVGWGGGGLTDRDLGVRGPHSFEGESGVPGGYGPPKDRCVAFVSA